MNLVIQESAFRKCTFDIDPSTLCFYGATEGYDYHNAKSMNRISFVLQNSEDTDKVVEEVKSSFRYSNSNVNDYIKVKDTFESWESDTRPRITILERTGMRGLKNPIEFYLIKG